jgi:hypothetical protein
MSAATGGTVINFSGRFSLTSMTGVFPPVVVTGLRGVTGTAGPDTINQISSPQVGAAPSAAAGPEQYNVPYTMQTGPVRYAPMPPLAPTKITAKNRSPQFPTSAYTVFMSEQGPPNADTTETLIQTFSVVSREPTVSLKSLRRSSANVGRWLRKRILRDRNSLNAGKIEQISLHEYFWNDKHAYVNQQHQRRWWMRTG